MIYIELKKIIEKINRSILHLIINDFFKNIYINNGNINKNNNNKSNFMIKYNLSVKISLI